MVMTAMENRSGRFARRVAIVTGAGQGIGRAVALRLAREGACVVVADLNAAQARATAEAIEAEGLQARDVVVDVTDPADVRRMAASAVEFYGGVDILVNNAGVLRSTAVSGISSEEWDLVLNVNLKGAFLCAQAVLDLMIARGGGRIVNMASMAGRATSTLGGAHYTAAKAGVLGLSRHLAREWAPYKINVNAVSPGIVDTPHGSRIDRRGADGPGAGRHSLRPPGGAGGDCRPCLFPGLRRGAHTLPARRWTFTAAS